MKTSTHDSLSMFVFAYHTMDTILVALDPEAASIEPVLQGQKVPSPLNYTNLLLGYSIQTVLVTQRETKSW